MRSHSKILVLVEGALMIALATILANIPFFTLPYGGGITLEMIPLVVMSFRHGTKWGAFTAFVHSVLQMLLGFSNVMYCPTLFTQFACIMLDYILAFTVLGFANMIANLFGKHRQVGVAVGSLVVCLLRFVCSYISGAWLWGAYMPETFNNVWWYSFVYNGSYMIPNTIIVVVAVSLLYKFAPKFFVYQGQAVSSKA